MTLDTFCGWFTETWYGRCTLVTLLPALIALFCVGFVLYTVAFLAWSVTGLPIMFIAKGVVIDPEFGGNWMREHK